MSRFERVVSLIGMPGSGKSSIGKMLAKRLGIPFVDTDVAVEQAAGSTIAQLFETEGESGFRRREVEALAELVRRGPAVIATGGGIVLGQTNRELLRRETVSIYLFANPATLWPRVRRNTKRPLLQVPEPYDRLCEIFEERHPIYRELASLVVETGHLPIRALVEDIVIRFERSAGASVGEGQAPPTPTSGRAGAP